MEGVDGMGWDGRLGFGLDELSKYGVWVWNTILGYGYRWHGYG